MDLQSVFINLSRRKLKTGSRRVFTFLSEKARDNISTISYFSFFYNFYNFTFLSEKASDSISRFLLFPQFHLFVRKSPRKHFYNVLFLFLPFHLFCQKKTEMTFVQFQLQLTSSDSDLSVHNTIEKVYLISKFVPRSVLKGKLKLLNPIFSH